MADIADEIAGEPGIQVVDDLEEEESSRPQLPARRRSAVPREDLLGQYLAEVRRYPLLEPEEERSLAHSYRETGDEEAARRLVTANLRLVVKLAFQYHRQWANVLDLIQEGNVGLVEALKRYDPGRGVRFSSYAQYWIRAMILRFLMDNYRSVRLGTTRAGRKLFFQLQKEREKLLSEGYSASSLQLADRLQVAESEVVIMDQHMRAPALSLHSPTGGQEDGRALEEVLQADEELSVDDKVAGRELGSIIRDHLTAFSMDLKDEREEAIWTERLLSDEPVPLSGLAGRFGISKERVRQIEARMRKRLSVYLREHMGEEMDFEFDLPDES